MRILIFNNLSEQQAVLTFEHLEYSDPQVRYYLGQFRASLDLLEEKGKPHEKKHHQVFPGVFDPDAY